MQANHFLSMRVSVLGIGALALILAGAPTLAQERSKPGTSGSAGSTRSTTATTQARSTSSPQTSGRQAVPRGNSSAGRGSGTTTRHSGRGRGTIRGGGYFRYPGYWGFGLGFGHRYGYSHYYYPYYHFGYGFPYFRHWEPYWYRYPAHRGLGALDLNVKPKKTQVYVDGALIGKTGSYDGFPGYLWLERGTHELVFYKDGFRTEVRKVRVIPEVVIDVDLWMESGPSRPASELMTQRGPEIEPARRERRAESRRPVPVPDETGSEEAPADERRDGDRGSRDVRGEPGRFRITAAPADSSVYLDGRFLGTAEEMGRLHKGLIVEAGDHVLEIVRPGFESERLDFSVEAGDSVELTVDLEPLAASL